MGSQEDTCSRSYTELPATLLLNMLLKGLNRFWTGQTYLVVVGQDERHRTRVPGSSYKSAFQIMQRKDATAKVAHYLPGVGGKE